MELGAEINQKVKKTIKKQLQALDCYVDDELPEYIMVMIANKRNEKEMVDDLTLFLGAEAEKFVSWLLVVLGRIKKAMDLPDIAEINSGELKKKIKKAGDCSSDEIKHKKANLKDKRKFREEKSEGDKIKKDKPSEKSEIEVGNKIMEKNDRTDEESLRKDKEKHKDKRREWQNEKEKVVDRINTKIQKKENEPEKKEERKKDVKKEKNVLNRKEKEKKEEKVEKAKAKVEDENGSEKIKNSKMQKIDKSLKKKSNLEKLFTKENDDSEDIRINAEAEARRIEQRTDRRSNPMEFVKKIAYDINKRLNVSETNVEKNEADNILESSNESSNNNINKTQGGTLNDSLHAVSQYEDEDVKTKKNKTDEKLSSNQTSLSKKEKNRSVSRTRTRSRSRSRSRTRYTNRLVNEQNSTKKKDRSRSRSPQRNFKSNDRTKGRSRSNSLHRTSRKDNKRRSRSNSLHRNISRDIKRRSRSNSLHRTIRKSIRSRSPKRNKLSHSRSPHKDNKMHRSVSPHRSRKHHPKSISPLGDNRDNKIRSSHKPKDEKLDKVKKEKLNDVIKKKSESSKDSRRRPNLQRDHQASSVLLKKAMAEVVIKKPLVDMKVTDNEEECTSDTDKKKILKENYDGNIEKILHIKSNEGISSDSHRDRRVINIDESQIMVCFNANDSNSRSKLKGSGKEHRDDLSDKNGMSKYDARFAILKSRDLNSKQLDKYSRSKTIKEPKKKEYAGSMVADIEEQARKQQRYTQRKMLRNNKRQSESNFPRKRVAEDSSESDSQSQAHTDILKTETRRIELQEITRHLKPTVDLRELLKRDKPLSDDEDVLARKLRQKLKEEKHKRLFGKLAPGEETILKEERNNLRKELKKKTIQKKITKQSVSNNLIVDKEKEITAEDEFSDEWVENEQSENTLNKSESKQRKFNEKNQKNKCTNDSYNEDVAEISVDKEAENFDGHNDIDADIKDSEIQIHLETGERSDENAEDSIEDEDANVTKNEITNTKTEDRINENTLKEKLVEKRKPKKKKVKHEFIVTLDGIDVNRHFSSNTESSLTRHSRQHKKESKDRMESSSFTQSDEEFEEIMKKKDKENEQLERSKRKHRESRHSYSRRRKISDGVERELELAEQKLKAQKLLRKSLKQVQNLDTKMLIEKTKHKTFINPHFQPKIPIIDNVSGSLNNFCLLPTLQLVVPSSPTVETNTLNEVNETIDTNISMKYSCENKEPIISNTHNVAVPLVVNSNETTNVKVTVEESSFPEQTNRTIQERCVYWPSCKNSFCKYVHPSIACKAFPKCSFGDRCLYIHPICKFGERCNVADCQYIHSKSLPLVSGSQQICNFGLSCSKLDCSFKHPISMPCRYGNQCKNRDCLYTHEKPATGSSLKWTAGKLHISERSFAVDESKVTEIPIAITQN